MAKRLRALTGLRYPDAKSLPIVLAAGGMSKLSEAQRKKVKLGEVKPGGWCDDLPATSRAHLIRAGKVEEVEAARVTAAEPRRASKKEAK